MPKKTKLPHCGQILTTKKTILDYMASTEESVFKGLLYCVAVGREDSEYKTVLYAVCLKLWFLSKMVYKSKDGIVKLNSKKYWQGLFEGYIETEEEVSFWLKAMGIHQADSNYVYTCAQPIELLWCHMISVLREQVSVSVLAYAADYVISRKGEVETPIFNLTYSSPIPRNYKDFNYVQGIAEYIDNKEYFV